MRSVGRSALVAALLISTGATVAVAQDTTTIPTQGIDRYTLPPGNSQATPTPVPTPSATPSPRATPTPQATPTPRATPSPRVTPTPSATPTPRATPAPSPTPTPTPSASPTPTPVETLAPPLATATPTPAPTATAPAPEPAVVDASSATEARDWLWWALGAALVAIGGIVAWRLRARRSDAIAPVDYDPVPAPAVAPPARTPARPAAPAAVPPVASATPTLALDLRPQRLWTRGPNAYLAFELIVTNSGTTTIEAIRPVITLVSAGPDTAADIAAFRQDAATLPSGEPFDLPPGKSCAIAGDLTLPGDAMYVTTAADRELIVPVVLASVGWRAAAEPTRASDAFVVGTGDATSARLGPIWVDRAGLVYERLDARRFTAGGR